jgi:hypothetical protein
MTHIAVQEKFDGKVVEWMEKVSDEQYPEISEFSRVKKPKPSAAPFTLDPRYKNACPQDGIEEG